MFFVMYDRNLNSIGLTYILEKWSQTQRATDFDTISLIGEQTPYSANPFIVVVNDKQGRLLLSGLASTPRIDDKSKKTEIQLKDYTTLFNSEIIVDWAKFSGSTVGSYLDFILSLWLQQVDLGFSTILWDTSNISDVFLDSSIPLGTGIENVLLKDLVYDAILYYDLYIIPELSLKNKSLTFHFHKAFLSTVEVKLSDFNILQVDKSFGDYNRATVYDHTYTKNQEWALTEDNSIVKLPSESKLVYPAKNRNFVSDYKEGDSVGNPQTAMNNALYDAVYNAVMGLAENRYQETVELNAHQYKSILDLTYLDFSYAVDVYFPDGDHSVIPVGEIETDSEGKHVVRLGHRIQELTQEI